MRLMFDVTSDEKWYLKNIPIPNSDIDLVISLDDIKDNLFYFFLGTPIENW